MVKKLYITPKIESLILDVDVWFLGASNNSGEGDDDDWTLSRRRQDNPYEYSSYRNNKQQGERWGSLW